MITYDFHPEARLDLDEIIDVLCIGFGIHGNTRRSLDYAWIP
jgi:hypothetical protein